MTNSPVLQSRFNFPIGNILEYKLFRAVDVWFTFVMVRNIGAKEFIPTSPCDEYPEYLHKPERLTKEQDVQSTHKI